MTRSRGEPNAAQSASSNDLARAVERDLDVIVTGIEPVSGGCISPAWRMTCRDDADLFVKTAPADAQPWMLPTEAASLGRIALTDTVRVPAVAAVTESWLALEWLEPGQATSSAWRGLGRDLARLHRNRVTEYGLDETNCIGPLPQANERTPDWPTFWGDQRLRPQLESAARHMAADDVTRCERLIASLDERLAGAAADGASLLHGDLGNGNVHFTAGGAALIDPSSYYGHREVDLAMAALFGGFPPVFHAEYEAEWPLLHGAAARRPIYQLYYLLVHVVLFGAGYVAQTRRVLNAALAG